MIKRISIIFTTIFIAQFFYGCTQVPITGRKQMNLLPESQMMSLALTSYSDFLKQNKVVSGSADAQMVQRVGQRIANAVTKYLAKKKNTQRIAGYKWEFNLVDNKEMNAWCMPGGKVVVYSGLLPVTQNENALAVVLGHEIAHAIARHGNERMSEQLALQLGGVGLQVAMSSQPQQTQNLFNQAYGIGSAVGVALPHSRKQETEADEMGLIFMALAGYNPHEATPFWQRMKSMTGNNKPPALLSTHPSDETRINNMKIFVPKAEAYVRTYGVLAN
jgi:predicted Zn-dependent protease